MEEAPKDIMLTIFGVLEARALARVKCVCRRWRDLASSENMWFHAVAADFGQLGAFVSTKRIPNRNWSHRARVMHQDAMYKNYMQMARLHSCVQTTYSWSIEVRKPGYQRNNDGELLFKATPIDVHYMGQCIAFSCDVPLAYLEEYSREWVYVLGTDHNNEQFVLSCARLSSAASRQSDQIWSTTCMLPRDGELKIVGYKLFASDDVPGWECYSGVTVFVHYGQTLFGVPPKDSSNPYGELKSPRSCGIPNWLKIPNACVFIDVFDVSGIHHCSLVCNLAGWRQVPDRLTEFRPWFAVGLESLRAEAPKSRIMRLYSHVCIYEVTKYRGTLGGRDYYDNGLFVEPLCWVDCELRYNRDSPGPVGLRIAGSGEFGLSSFECIVMGMETDSPTMSLVKSKRPIRRGSASLHWW